MNKKKDVNFLVCGAVIAALYAALTYAASAVNLAYGAVQFRFSEALTVLAAYTPAAIPGLTIGCLLANLGSPYGITDIICGSAATLLAAVFTYLTRKVKVKGPPLLAPGFSVVFNAVIVGAEIAVFLPEGFTFKGFLIQAAFVGLGELVVCYAAGMPLCAAINKTGLRKYLK